MIHAAYSYFRIQPMRYTFESHGKKRIQKIVDFVPTGSGNIVNLGFGDLQSDGTIDDTVNSNNGDIVKVLATVVDILRDFTTLYPQSQVLFAGSTKERTRLYSRIIKVYYSQFIKEFAIVAAIDTGSRLQYIPFESSSNNEYLAFVIKRNS
jgi:hypothetical protein